MAGSIILDGFVVLSCVVFTLYLIGLNNFLSKHSDNGCEMTYMYEYPQYVKISLPLNVTDQYQRYGLYAYGEGRLIEKIRSMEFNGLPVLFIPGHSGSHKQVRSLASVSLRKALGSHSPFHFDFFTVNLNEEYSAVYGGVLKDQTRFVIHCINKIFSLYQRNLPDSIVLVGHSMGGIVAKGLFIEPDFNPKLVRLVVTLATPHYPVIYTDTMLYDYYNSIGPDWTSFTNSSVTLVSIGGGVKDVLVRSGLTLTRDADISVVTTAVPEVWLSTDHLCILWCKQLVLVLVRTLFDSVNATTRQISTDPEWRRNVFAYHLVNRTAGKHFRTSQHFPQVTLWNGKTHPGEWREFLIRQYTVFESNGVRTPTHIMVRMFDTRQYEKMAISAFNHEGKDWIFACKARSLYGDMRVCDEAENLSDKGRIAPTKMFKHKVAYLDLKRIKSRGHQFIIIKLPPSDEPVQVQYDVHAASDRLIIPASLPHWLQCYWVNIIKSTDHGALRYTLALPEFERIWQAYRIKLTAKNCTSSMHQAVMTLRVPWDNEHVSAILSNGDTVVLPLILHTPKPVNWGPEHPEVQLYLDADCVYSVDIQSSPVDSLGQLVRIYSPQLVAYIAAILLLTMRQQLMSLGTKQQCVMFHTALVNGAKPYYILPLVKIISKILGSCMYPEFIETYIPMPDLVLLQDLGLDFLLLPFFLYLVAFAIIYLLGLAIHVSIIINGQAVHKIVLRFIGRFVSQQYSEWLLIFVHKVPVLVVACMLALKYTACGGLALLIGTIFYYLKVCSLYEDYLEELFLAPLRILKNKLLARWRRKTPNQHQEQQNNDDILRDVGDEIGDLISLKSLTEINFHISVMMLWGLSALIHISSVLVWAHNFGFSTSLKPDPASGAAAIMAVCGFVFWSLHLPQCDNQVNLYENIGNLMFVFATLTLVYSTVSLYNLHIILSAAFVSMMAHQLYQFHQYATSRRDSVPLLVPIDDDATTTTTTNDISENSKDKDDTDSDNDDSDENYDDDDDLNDDGDNNDIKKNTDTNKSKLDSKTSQSFDLDDDLSLKDIDAENISTSECDKLTPDESEISSRKDSRTSELSVSSYEALSLTEVNKSSDKN